ncbi:MAG TPA: hypothetical protein VK616_07955 [Flavitalea sp.]|nr:hypothetical protein [Flavitalea sp.]
MAASENILLDYDAEVYSRRRTLLPWWVKIFVWIFLILGILGLPGAILFGVLGYHFQLSLFGLETTEPFSIVGLILIFLFGLKGWTSYCLWWEKDNAITFGKIDALLSIGVCIVMMFVNPFVVSQPYSKSIRLELVLLIPYLIWVFRVSVRWKTPYIKKVQML